MNQPQTPPAPMRPAEPSATGAPFAHGIVLMAHGSRDRLWREPIEAVRQHIEAAHPGRPVRCAYLEMCAPDLPTAVDELVSAGAQHITIVPLFLGTGQHARRDLPLLVDALRKAHPQLVFDVQRAVGEDPRMTALMAEIAATAVQSS